jgi:hypothetical protein
VTLKQAVEDPGSPLRAFFSERLPYTKALRTTWQQRGLNSVAIKPTVTVIKTRAGKEHTYPYDEVGHAAELRLILLFTPDLKCATAAHVQHPITKKPWAAVNSLQTELAATWARTSGFTALSDDEERRLLGLCYVAGLFDQYTRIGPYPGLPLLETPPDATVDHLIESLAADACLDDLFMIVRAARPVLADLGTQTNHVIAGPAFAGSADVGGADGDLIVDGTLLEIKTRLKLDLQQRHLYQLVAYALLDYDDVHCIRELAIFSARHSNLARWLLRDVITVLAGAPLELDQLRRELRAHLQSFGPGVDGPSLGLQALDR